MWLAKLCPDNPRFDMALMQGQPTIYADGRLCRKSFLMDPNNVNLDSEVPKLQILILAAWGMFSSFWRFFAQRFKKHTSQAKNRKAKKSRAKGARNQPASKRVRHFGGFSSSVLAPPQTTHRVVPHVPRLEVLLLQEERSAMAYPGLIFVTWTS